MTNPISRRHQVLFLCERAKQSSDVAQHLLESLEDGAGGIEKIGERIATTVDPLTVRSSVDGIRNLIDSTAFWSAEGYADALWVGRI